MLYRCWPAAWSALTLVCCLSNAFAEPAGHIGYAYPAGARQGAEVAVKVGGQHLQAAYGAFVSGGGVEATVTDHYRPMGGKEELIVLNKLRRAAAKLQVGMPMIGDPASVGALAKIAHAGGVTDRELTQLAEIFIDKSDPKCQRNQQIEETVSLLVKVDSHAAPGMRDLRLIGPNGVSNAIHFVVGQFREQNVVKASDKSPNDLGDRLPVVANGQIMPGQTDRWTFDARKGSHVVIGVCARELVPYLADAVLGWFQASIELFDSHGNQIDFADHYQFHPDPLILFDAPADGRYTVAIHDALYRGREDFVYRMTIGEIPFISSIFPLGGAPNKNVLVHAQGWNLPAAPISVDTSGHGAGIIPVTATVDSVVSNGALFQVDPLPTFVAKDSADAGFVEQQVTLPVMIEGRIGAPHQIHKFRFDGKAGQRIVAEVYARRLNSPLDSVLQLTDSHGKAIACNDDTFDAGAGLLTHQADSYISTTLPATGSYDLSIWDSESKGGPDYVYRLRISSPRADFELRIISSAINVQRGSSGTFTVQAIRRDGFTGQINLALKNAPAGLVLSGGPIPAKHDKVQLRLSAGKYPLDLPFPLELSGTAIINGVTVSHLAVPADDHIQAFAYQHLVPMDSWVVDVIRKQTEAATEPDVPV